MHRLIVNKLEPIERCESECSQFMTLTGFQASGESTIAKVINTEFDELLNLQETDEEGADL